MCYHAEFGHSRSNDKNVRTEIRQKNWAPRVPSFKVTESHRNRQYTDRSATRDFLLVIRSSLTMGLSYRFRDKRRFQLKIAKFSRPRVSNVHADSRWNFGGGAQKRDWCAYQPREGQAERQKWYNNIALCVPAHATLILMFCSSFWD